MFCSSSCQVSLNTGSKAMKQSLKAFVHKFLIHWSSVEGAILPMLSGLYSGKDAIWD